MKCSKYRVGSNTALKEFEKFFVSFRYVVLLLGVGNMRTIVSVSVESKLASDFDAMCADEKITKSELISSWIEAYVKRRSNEPEMTLCPKCGARYAQKLNYCPTCTVADARIEHTEAQNRKVLTEKEENDEVQRIFEAKVKAEPSFHDEFVDKYGSEQYSDWKTGKLDEIKKKLKSDAQAQKA